jgi:hypothetical protein
MKQQSFYMSATAMIAIASPAYFADLQGVANMQS